MFVGVDDFSVAMYSVRRRKGTAIWECEREGVVAVSGVFNNARSRGWRSERIGSAYRPGYELLYLIDLETTRFVAFKETGDDGEVEGHAAFNINVNIWRL